MKATMFEINCECGMRLELETELPEAIIYAAFEAGWGLNGHSFLCPVCVEDYGHDDLILKPEAKDGSD